MSAPFLLDCCAYPNHSVRYHEDDSKDTHEWYCKTCGQVWTPQEYDAAAVHDEQMAKDEANYFDYGKDRV
jgi:hypothetical protein